MARKQALFKTKGMNRDLSVSAFNPEFSFENMNIRLSTNEGNTMMSWVNERGPKKLRINQEGKDEEETFKIIGMAIGTAVINHKLVLFTTNRDEDDTAKDDKPDRIYVLKYRNSNYGILYETLLYEGNLNFSRKHPIETLIYWETTDIEKVYWTDSYNQPRLINIAADDTERRKWRDATGDGVTTVFDFVPTVKLSEGDLTVEKNMSGLGLFAPGEIQYCYTYINKHGQQSNVITVSPLYYLNHKDRGAKPDDTVSCSFHITINNIDKNFDYIRLYSIQRTAIDSTASVRLLDDISIDKSKSEVEYTDNGTGGATLEPSELQYVGGREITASTMADKDNTLFLGGIVEKNTLMTDIQDYYDTVREKSGGKIGLISYYNDDAKKQLTLDHAFGTYSHTNTLRHNQREITTYKGGETYRFGFQLQKATGEWLEPVYLEDVRNELYPKTTISDGKKVDTVNLVYAKGEINIMEICAHLQAKYNNQNAKEDFKATYKRIRPVIVFPNIGDRSVLCQGVLNPTVFNVEDRKDNSPFAQASWFFRPYIWPEETKKIESSTDKSAREYAVPEDAVQYTVTDSTQDFTVPEFFKDNVKAVNVLVATITDSSKAEEILKTKKLVYKYGNTSSSSTGHDEDEEGSGHRSGSKTVGFAGAIVLKSGEYAFISPSQWKAAGDVDGVAYSYEGLENVKTGNVESSDQKNLLYKEMKTDGENLYEYWKPSTAGSEDSFVFKFVAGNYYYKVTFNYIGETINYNVSSKDCQNSSALRFRHYDSLYTTSDLPSVNIGSGTTALEQSEQLSAYHTAARQIEIQGSVESYATPYTADNATAGSAATNANEKSNSQFFIDQSIVTLNSPDIDWDTEVQAYSTENLKLRIVGAIPITAGISSHSITISSSMLEAEHSNIEKTEAVFGVGEKANNVRYDNVNTYAGKRLVSDYLWNDVFTKSGTNKDLGYIDSESVTNFLVYPWQRTGSLNNDYRDTGTASSVLKTKVMANMMYSVSTVYLDNDSMESFDKTGVQIPLTENGMVTNYRLSRQKTGMADINYYCNIDKVLVNSEGYPVINNADEKDYVDYATVDGTKAKKVYSPVGMRYRSTSHAVIALDAEDDENQSIANTIPILPYGKFTSGDTEEKTGNYKKKSTDVNSYKTFWGDDNLAFSQGSIDLGDLFSHHGYNYLWLGEIYKDTDKDTIFGGSTRNALTANRWIPAGEPVSLTKTDKDGNVKLQPSIPLYWTTGDTYFQRYDCLKTYPYNEADSNQIVEILSFMCETRINIDGRYDRNRGQSDNTLMAPQNFNLLNTAYSQTDNFFLGRKTGVEDSGDLSYPNQIYYSKTKTSGADVDMYTNVTLASMLEMDGDKGSVNAIKRLNDQLISFQDTGIAQILYNENVQVSATNGVPIELANSGKVQGKRYFSNTVGCSNKWSMVTTPSGIYFMDSNDKGIYLFNGELHNLSVEKGMNSWSRQNIPDSTAEWRPDTYGATKDTPAGTFAAYYDRINQDVLFINAETALAYSERFGVFTSFYDYGCTPYYASLDDTGIWVRHIVNDKGYENYLYSHNRGEYNDFFGTVKPYWTTLAVNPEPQADKIFTNMELRATVDGEGTTDSTGKYTPALPFDSIEAWNEYQHGTTVLGNISGIEAIRHANNPAALKRRFRIWHCDIPRDSVKPLDRIRNPWMYLKLMKSPAEGATSMDRAEIHDVGVTYYS